MMKAMCAMWSWGRVMAAFARRRAAAVITVGLIAFGGCMAAAAFRGIPAPLMYDEFSYLLAADTYAHGRMANPPVGFDDFFRTVYVLDHPTYMSKYLPGQGLFLAAGQLAFGHPIYGVWLSVALMSAAICWMLLAWVPPVWAFTGGLIAAAQFGVFSYWSNSYWGGAITALGGALVFGALPRLLRHQHWRDVLWTGAGLALLLNTRLWEGLAVGLPLGLLLLPWERRPVFVEPAVILRKAALPLVVVLIVVIGAMGRYNTAVTGQAAEFPYMVYEQQKQSVPLFIWQPLKKDVHVREYYQRLLQSNDEFYYFEKRTWTGFIVKFYRDLRWLFDFYFGFPLALGAVLVLLRLRGAYERRFVLGVVLILLSIAVVAFRVKNHYYAAWTSLAVLLIVQGLRMLRGMTWGGVRMGLPLVAALMVIQFLMGLLNVRTQEPFSKAELTYAFLGGIPKTFQREELKNALIREGGTHLVFVKYAKAHNYYDEWVYNGADMKDAPVLWARDLGPARNMDLIRRYPDRKVWHVTVSWNFQDRYFTDAPYPLAKITVDQMAEGRPTFNGGTVPKRFFQHMAR